jgi:hypothetical protein
MGDHYLGANSTHDALVSLSFPHYSSDYDTRQPSPNHRGQSKFLTARLNQGCSCTKRCSHHAPPTSSNFAAGSQRESLLQVSRCSRPRPRLGWLPVPYIRKRQVIALLSDIVGQRFFSPASQRIAGSIRISFIYWHQPRRLAPYLSADQFGR